VRISRTFKGSLRCGANNSEGRELAGHRQTSGVHAYLRRCLFYKSGDLADLRRCLYFDSGGVTGDVTVRFFKESFLGLFLILATSSTLFQISRLVDIDVATESCKHNFETPCSGTSSANVSLLCTASVHGSGSDCVGKQSSA